MDFVDQLQKNAEPNDERQPVDDKWEENGKAHVPHEEAVRGLRDAMKAVSDMLSSAEEIIRQRILRSPQPTEPTPKTCACHTNGARTAAPTAPARKNVDKATMTTTDLEPPPPPSSHNLKKSKHRKGSDIKPTGNSLDDYLDGAMLGDDDPAFVDAVRGWDAPPAHSVAANASKPLDMFMLDGPELHDVMMKNNIRFANLQAHLQAQAQAQAHAEAQAKVQAQQHHTRQMASSAAPPAYRGISTLSSSSITGKHKAAKVLATKSSEKKAKKRKLTISTSSTDPTSPSSVMSPPANASRRLVRETVANLTAKRVLQIRDFSSVCEYLIEWKELVEPIWVQRRQCAPQGKEVIDKFNKIRLQQARRATRERAAISRTTKSTGEATETAEGDVYIVDRIVGHQGRRSKKQYLVKWDGYDSSENTWEAASKLQREVPEIVDEYEKRVAISVNTQQQKAEGVTQGPEAVAKRESVCKASYDKKKPRPSVASLKSKRRSFAPEENQELVDTDDDVEIMSEVGASDQYPSDEDDRSTFDLENEVVVIDSDDELIDVKSV
uniref:Chromo domain-containing protein n=1 Tax=Globisporangium ultimum (strain ATCC 200006 / CBS 805.95 / DAOM BR144) TaxID=431595 RepID=K3X9G9_GLOUD